MSARSPSPDRRTGGKRRLGQYFTPRETAGFVLEGASRLLSVAGDRPQEDGPARRLVDPACGDGVFLELALERGVVTKRGAFGIEIDPDLARRARGFGLDGQVTCADALADPLPALLERARRAGFDLVVGNPPFGPVPISSRGGAGGNGRLEIRFAERFAELTAPGGAGGVILPLGVFTNATAQGLRDSLLGVIEPAAVVELPPSTFRRAGASARTCALFFRKRTARRNARCLVVGFDRGAGPRSYFDAVLRALGDRPPVRTKAGSGRKVRAAPGRTGELPPGANCVPVKDLRGRRWDPAYWCSVSDAVLERTRVPLAPLGEFIEHITYGPIVTGERARRAEPGPVRVVGLREMRATGLDLRRARRVRSGGIHDPERCRLRRGDIVLARSGAGSLMKGRVAVFGGGAPATVGCFVDLVRLRGGLRPGYAVLALRSRVMRAQVERLANGVGTPNLSFAEIRSLLVPRPGQRFEERLAREEAAARRLHARALSAGREPVAAARRIEAAVKTLEEAVMA